MYIEPLRETDVINGDVDGFIHETFSNLTEIVGYHQRMLDALFIRQRDQHPLIQSVADIILESTYLCCVHV